VNILISAAGGLIGRNLVAYLQSKGFSIYKLVRGQSSNDNELFWNPYSENINLPNNIKFDAVIHLSGENISKGRWTKSKKERIVCSRVESTKNLVNAIIKMETKPDTFICASAIGYYGDRGNKILTEDDEAGDDFISDMTIEWEDASQSAEDKGIRIINLRTGLVLSNEGGALPKLILPFKFGVGAITGNGKQYMSWIAMEDLIGGIYHSLINPNINGPINLVSPNPCTNRDFNKTLGGVLKRPAFFVIPSFIIKIIFGQMGKELLLSSTRVHPQKLLESGYTFNYPELEKALIHILKESN